MNAFSRRHKNFYLNTNSAAKIRVSEQSTKCMSVKLKIYDEKKKREGYASTKNYCTNYFYIFSDITHSSRTYFCVCT